jgi:isopenicillin-N epimerase
LNLHRHNSELAARWQLATDLVFLNHGSFGATPTEVLLAQRAYQDQLEADPIAFLAPERDLEGKLDDVRSRLASFVSAPADCLGFVRNATDGVNAVLRSFPFETGDEIIVTNHAYNACVNAVHYAAQCFNQRLPNQAPVRVVEAKIPFPLADAHQVVDQIRACINPRSKLLLIDHITSPTGLIWPIAEVIQMAHQHGVRVLVDGAHGPGMVELDLSALCADYYTANHHKWLCAPKVSGFLYVDKRWQAEVRPTVISHAANRPRPARSRFIAEFDWTGTFDPTPLLALPHALDFLESLCPGGIRQLMQENRQKALNGRQLVLDALQLECPAPVDMIGSLAAVPLPDSRFDQQKLSQLKTRLYDDYRIELPIFPTIDHCGYSGYILRIAMQAYNDLNQIEKLVAALKQLLN